MRDCEDDSLKKEALIDQTIATLHNQSNFYINLYFRQFYKLVKEEKVIPARYYIKLLYWINIFFINVFCFNLFLRSLCEQLLLNDHLIPENKCIWRETFVIIKSLLQCVDYKGVREILKLCREKATKCFKKDLCSDESIQVNVLVDVLKYIFDRNACLLPAYFIITEIQKCDMFEIHWVILYNVYIYYIMLYFFFYFRKSID